MVGKIMSKPEARKTPGKKMATTTYKKGGAVKKAKGGTIKKNMGGMMPNNQMSGNQMMPNTQQTMMHGGKVSKRKKK
tara:strand:- start:116 stop:346 length:231 start_codon:yes stop_codon:yes gene_type:complete